MNASPPSPRLEHLWTRLETFPIYRADSKIERQKPGCLALLIAAHHIDFALSKGIDVEEMNVLIQEERDSRGQFIVVRRQRDSIVIRVHEPEKYRFALREAYFVADQVRHGCMDWKEGLEWLTFRSDYYGGMTDDVGHPYKNLINTQERAS